MSHHGTQELGNDIPNSRGRFSGNGIFCKRRTPLHRWQWRSWLRGADLNRRPLGYAT